MELRNLDGIFEDGKLFRIPDYQRGYSWEEEHLNDLWSDIDILLKDNKEQEHYTGVLSVVPKEEDGSIHIVDGQQRITTLIILIKVICDAVSDVAPGKWINNQEQVAYVARYLHRKTGKQNKRTEVIFEYEEDNASHTYFKTKILKLTDTKKCRTGYPVYQKP